MGGKWPRASGPAARLAPCPCGDGSGCRQACPTPVCLGLCGAEAVSWSQDQAGGVAGKDNSRGAPRPAVRSPLALPGTITAPVRRLLRCTWPTCWPWAARSRGPEAPPCSPSLAAVWAAALGRVGVQGLSTGPRFPTTFLWNHHPHSQRTKFFLFQGTLHSVSPVSAELNAIS